MIWNDRFLFLHYPKAAGKSLSVAFLKAWPGEVEAYISKGQILELGPYIKEGSTLRILGAHQNAVKADRILKRQGRSVRDFEAVFLAVRSPYDLICSTYYFYRRSFEKGSKKEEFRIAAEGTLENFIRNWVPSSFEPWMFVDGEPLENLRVIRFEHMQKDFRKYAAEFNFQRVHIPHLNSNDARDYRAELNEELEEIIYEKYKFLFDCGYYERASAAEGPRSVENAGGHG